MQIFLFLFSCKGLFWNLLRGFNVHVNTLIRFLLSLCCGATVHTEWEQASSGTVALRSNQVYSNGLHVDVNMLKKRTDQEWRFQGSSSSKDVCNFDKLLLYHTKNEGKYEKINLHYKQNTNQAKSWSNAPARKQNKIMLSCEIQNRWQLNITIVSCCDGYHNENISVYVCV